VHNGKTITIADCTRSRREKARNFLGSEFESRNFGKKISFGSFVCESLMLIFFLFVCEEEKNVLRSYFRKFGRASGGIRDLKLI
jgi:hypothetical protein